MPIEEVPVADPKEPCNMGLHEAALEGMPLPVIVHDLEMVIYANAEACRALGAASRELLEGRPLSEITHPDGREAGSERRRFLMETGHVFRDIAVKMLDVNGETVYVTGNASRIIYCGRPAIMFVATRTA